MDGRLIRAGSLQGVEALDAAELTAGLSQHPPDGWLTTTYAAYDPLELSLDRQRIESYYRDRGHFKVRVIDTKVEPYEDGVRVDFVIEEGPAFKIRTVAITGTASEAVDLQDIGQQAARKAGLGLNETFTYAHFASAKDGLTDALMHRGFAHAVVGGEILVFEEDTAVEVRIDVDPGPLVHFGDIEIDAGWLPEESIRARLDFAPGDRYDPAALVRTESRIYELGMVGVVGIYLPTEGRPARLDVRIEVRPGKRNELRVGLGVARQNPNYQTRLRLGYVRRDFFDPLLSLSAEARPALIYRPGDRTFAFGIELSAALTREDLLLPRLTGTAEVQYNVLQYEAYSTRGPAFRLIGTRPFLHDRLRLSVAANFKLFDFPRVDDVIPTDRLSSIGLPNRNGTPTGLSLLYLEPAVTYDGRDDPVDPGQGAYARLQFEFGQALDASGATWLKLTPEVRAYLSLGTRRVVAAGRARLGAKLLPGEPLPATQRYFGGGSESQRGFTIRQLSPFFGTGDEAVPVGGEALWELSAELRFRIVRLLGMWFGAVAFVDAADVGANFSELDFAEPHVATGGGVRLYTPIGPVRFDVGYRLNRVDPGVEPGGSDRVAFHISLGEAF